MKPRSVFAQREPAQSPGTVARAAIRHPNRQSQHALDGSGRVRDVLPETGDRIAARQSGQYTNHRYHYQKPSHHLYYPVSSLFDCCVLASLPRIASLHPREFRILPVVGPCLQITGGCSCISVALAAVKPRGHLVRAGQPEHRNGALAVVRVSGERTCRRRGLLHERRVLLSAMRIGLLTFFECCSGRGQAKNR